MVLTWRFFMVPLIGLGYGLHSRCWNAACVLCPQGHPIRIWCSVICPHGHVDLDHLVYHSRPDGGKVERGKI